MQAVPDKMRIAIRFGHHCPEHLFFSIFVIVVCVSVAAVVHAANITNYEIGAHASISLFVLLLLAFSLTSLTLTGLARLTWLPGLVGHTTRLATSSA